VRCEAAEKGMAAPVARTASECQKCRRSLERLGYIAPSASTDEASPWSRQSPLVNRTSWSRVAVMEALVSRFVGSCQSSCQIVSLGAGFSPCVMNACRNYSHVKGFDVDTEENVALRRAEAEQGSRSGGYPPDYFLIAADIRDSELLSSTLDKTGIAWGVRTLVILECVLQYLTQGESRGVLGWANSFHRGCVAIYGPVGELYPGDFFWSALDSHFSRAHCPLSCAEGGVQGQELLLRHCGWPYCAAWNLTVATSHFIPLSERKRVSLLEPFDEFAGLALFQQHYAISLGCMEQNLFHELAQPNEEMICPAATGVTVRPVRSEEDLPAVQILYQDGLAEISHHKSVAKFIRRVIRTELCEQMLMKKEGVMWFVAECTGEIVGCAAVYRKGDGLAEVKHVSVKRTHRGGGIGKVLLQYCEEHALDRGIRLLSLSTLSLLTSAQALYAACGWKCEKKVGIGDGIDVISFSKNIGACSEVASIPICTKD
jgi:N-acetylglutamate synthase-like GNAT family acetyltransferase